MTVSRPVREAVASLARRAREQDLDDILETITHTAVDVIDGVDYCSVSLPRGQGPVETVAPTHPIAVAADELQYELQVGRVRAVPRPSLVLCQVLTQHDGFGLYGGVAGSFMHERTLAVSIALADRRQEQGHLSPKRNARRRPRGRRRGVFVSCLLSA